MNSWIATSDELPHEGDAVWFVVEQRCIVLCGTYADCTFKSRWSRYHPGDVSEWCRPDADVPPHPGSGPRRDDDDRVARAA
jgi:hypothetical protein